MSKGSPHEHHDRESDPNASHETHGGDGKGPGEHAGHDQHEGHSPKMFRDKFWLSFALTIPVVYWSEHIQMLLGYQAPEFYRLSVDLLRFSEPPFFSTAAWCF
jgi:P-type Cu2+ transporter